jgi:hypothetical protein
MKVKRQGRPVEPDSNREWLIRSEMFFVQMVDYRPRKRSFSISKKLVKMDAIMGRETRADACSCPLAREALYEAELSPEQFTREFRRK